MISRDAKEKYADKTEKFAHKKSLGQNFLTSDAVPRHMCDAGRVAEGDIVLEVGPGTGALTREILKRGATVYAIETDERAITILEGTFATEIAAGLLHLIHADMREFDLMSVVGQFNHYKVIANIPYYLSGFLLRTVLELDHQPSLLVFLMQKEVVERITRDKKSSLLSLSVAVYGKPVYVKTIKRGHFSPPPKVDSAILLVADISTKNLPGREDREVFFYDLHLGLGQKRKQLLGTLAPTYGRERIAAIFAEQGLLPTVRGEDLPLDAWLRLTQAIHK
jgi:16S rRNA (adenine1518-N6/adenine1519-N6)-dimethyltransferase